MKVLTITVNPSVDVSTRTPRVIADSKVRCDQGRVDPGGGGINVSRAVVELGETTLAIVTAGGRTGDVLLDRVRGLGVPVHAVPVAAPSRLCFNVAEEQSGKEYRFVLAGPSLTEAECRACLEATRDALKGTDAVVVSGSLPPGAPDDFCAQLLQLAVAKGIPVVLDTSGAPLRAALGQGALFIKPSRRELRELTGQPLESLEALAETCRRLVSDRVAQIVVVSLGAEGALATGAKGQWRAMPLKIRTQSAVGAGDSFVAGMTVSLLNGEGLDVALRKGSACGSAALLTPGTELFQRAKVEELLPAIELARLA